MSRTIHLLGVLLAGGLMLASVGCNEPQKEAPVEQPGEDAQARIRELEDLLAQAQRDRQADQRQIDALQAELDKLKKQASEMPKDWKGVPGGAMTSIEGTVLFDSGKAALKPGAKSVLTQVASTIKQQFPNHEIYVFGHTDTDPIKHSGWKDNYELSCQRSLSVLRFLRSDGVGNPIAACGWGEDRPVADNATAEAKQANRRVEIYAMQPRP